MRVKIMPGGFGKASVVIRHVFFRKYILYQLASTRPPVTKLMNFRCALSAWDPESGFYPETSDGFLAREQTANVLQILPRLRSVLNRDCIPG